MPYNPERHHRRSIRYRGYDYTQPGAYFITICTHNREPLFGEVVDGEMHCNAYGDIVRAEWFKTAEIRPYVRLYNDEFTVMPNHAHGNIWIVEDGRSAGRGDRPVAPTPPVTPTPPIAPTMPVVPTGPPPHSLGAIMAGFKSATTKRINIKRQSPGAPVWQRNYYDRIIRNERALRAICQYIIDNPMRWHLDRYNPDADGPDPHAREIWRLLR